MNDIKFSFKFAQTHLDIGIPAALKAHALRHRSDADAIRGTDNSAAALVQRFRDNIDNKHTADNATGYDDYAQMVDIVIRNGGLLDHYAGPRDLAHWAEAKNLKEQFQNVLSAESLGDLRTNLNKLQDNRALNGALSVGRTALHSAVTEIQATMGEELTPAVIDALATSILTELNAASLEVNGEKVTVQDFRDYLAEVGDGIMKPPEFKI